MIIYLLLRDVSVGSPQDMARVAQSHAAVARSLRREQPMHVRALRIAARYVPKQLG